MMDCRRCIAVLTAVLLVLGQGTASAGDLAKGRALAEAHCARCHVVGDFNPHGGIGSTPSLQWIKKLPDWRDRFQTFYVRRPHLAFVKVRGLEPPTKLPPYAAPIELSPGDAEDVFAFIEALPVPKGNSDITPIEGK
jgi:mono/diheme cytochrome c family protein